MPAFIFKQFYNLYRYSKNLRACKGTCVLAEGNGKSSFPIFPKNTHPGTCASAGSSRLFSSL